MKYILLIALLTTTGCASIVSDSNYPVTVNSPEPFTITNSKGMQVASMPSTTTVMLKAGAGYFQGATYTVKTKCNQSIIDSTLDGWYVGNILLGGVIGGLLVDPVTGAMFKLPAQVSVAGCGNE